NQRHRKREAPPWSRQQSGNIPRSLHRIGIVDEAIFVQDDLWIIVSEYSREKTLSLLGQIWYAPTCRFTLRKYQHVHIHLVPFFSSLAVLTWNTVTHSLDVVANPISFATYLSGRFCPSCQSVSRQRPRSRRLVCRFEALLSAPSLLRYMGEP